MSYSVGIQPMRLFGFGFSVLKCLEDPAVLKPGKDPDKRRLFGGEIPRLDLGSASIRP